MHGKDVALERSTLQTPWLLINGMVQMILGRKNTRSLVLFISECGKQLDTITDLQLYLQTCEERDIR